MARKKKTAQSRNTGKTQISISLSTSLVKRIDKLAKAQNRNRSNFITNAMLDVTGG
ncbi:ribbon-helix-helix domain-containing protein [Rubellicoccus peritrichatus]|uniref:Ribbon-helix-helix domain-containing protein n=1 Tax=Rubellicoccus peritrichatus TaxID=3080537 RepID=A0AAQ3LE66_9BACT|nr:ribbon-helix-helix domain-containing protein [Puniceicoccus sp. CR14]WOO42864.1 ribbon-helix-helix domain-containing protein [Puniceicoccus sp. CR14]